MLSRLAKQNHVHIQGNERSGSFSSSGVHGDYEFGKNCIRGTFAGHGVKGEFSFELGQAAVTINQRPFWLPEILLKQKITKGLNSLCDAIA
jgi:hypothetical protein